MGGTAGRTTLNGEGLQHEDGHSHLYAATIPNCVSYDPTYAHEVAVIIQDGLRRMYTDQEDVFYYLTIMNENYEHPGLPEDRRDEVIEGIKRGMYLLRSTGSETAEGPRVQLLGSGTILREVEAAADLLAGEHGISADVWSCPSFTELGRDTLAVDRWNLLHPGDDRRTAWVTDQLAARAPGPVIASTDYMRAFAEQIRPAVPADRRYVVLGTDGYGRSDYRKALRRHFEVDRWHVVVATLSALAADGTVPVDAVRDAIARYDIDVDKISPARA
jgi:pyruvate dehydrogenase E1 component